MRERRKFKNVVTALPILDETAVPNFFRRHSVYIQLCYLSASIRPNTPAAIRLLTYICCFCIKRHTDINVNCVK